MDDRNLKIAKVLGFRFLKDGQVIYPPDWQDEVKAVPVKSIPDFVGIMDNYKRLAQELKYGIPTDYGH